MVEPKVEPKPEPKPEPILNFENQEMQFVDTDSFEIKDDDILSGGIECDELPA